MDKDEKIKELEEKNALFHVNVLNINKIIYIILFYSVDCPLSIMVSLRMFFMILSSNALFLSVPIPPNAD